MLLHPFSEVYVQQRNGDTQQPRRPHLMHIQESLEPETDEPSWQEREAEKEGEKDKQKEKERQKEEVWRFFLVEVCLAYFRHCMYRVGKQTTSARNNLPWQSSTADSSLSAREESPERQNSGQKNSKKEGKDSRRKEKTERAYALLHKREELTLVGMHICYPQLSAHIGHINDTTHTGLHPLYIHLSVCIGIYSLQEDPGTRRGQQERKKERESQKNALGE